MPELPEVERACNLVRKFCLHHKVAAVLPRESGGGPRDGLFDDIICDKSNENAITDALHGKILLGVKRKGKQMWFELGHKRGSEEVITDCVLFHFGMTGAFSVQGADRLTFRE